jgi:acetolactate decarboxylase
MKVIVTLIAVLLLACDSSESPAPQAVPDAPSGDAAAITDAAAQPPAVEVKWFGSLKTIFAGDWSTSIALRDVVATTDAYALGALSDLRGEFLVIGGKVMLVYPTEMSLPRVVAEHGGSSETATLLVTAEVPQWREFTFEADVPGDGLEGAILAKAEANGVDVAKPFPFLLQGVLRDVEWHVADGMRVEPGMRPDANAQHGALAETEGTVVGFYSTEHQGVFTMMGQNSHMHVVTSDHSVVGHVRTLAVSAGCVLSLP